MACGGAARAVVPVDTETALAHHGAVNPTVTQETIGSTICVPGWTATIRPPISYTAPIKRALWVKAGSHGTLSDYELDHWVPLEVGGAPSDPKNLVLQPSAGPDGAHAKDVVENRVHREVCAGTITLAVGEQCFLVDWRKCP